MQYIELTAAAHAALAEQLDTASAGDAALPFRQRAVALEPEDPRWVLQLADEFAITGREAELKQLLQRAAQRRYGERFSEVVQQLRQRWPAFFDAPSEGSVRRTDKSDKE